MVVVGERRSGGWEGQGNKEEPLTMADRCSEKKILKTTALWYPGQDRLRKQWEQCHVLQSLGLGLSVGGHKHRPL